MKKNLQCREINFEKRYFENIKVFFGFFDAELPLVWQTSSIISAEGKKCVRDPKSTRGKGN
jgi:hypothetical protein